MFHALAELCELLLQNIGTLSFFIGFIFWSLFAALNYKVFNTDLLQSPAFCLLKRLFFLYSFCFILMIMRASLSLHGFKHVFMIRFDDRMLDSFLDLWDRLSFDLVAMTGCSFFM